MTHISNYGELQKHPGGEFMLHPDANVEKGGFELKDEDGIMPAAFKNIAKKVAERVSKGQISDIGKIPAPSYIHHYFSHCRLVTNDMTNNCNYLTKAAKIEDPLERMKLVVTNFISSHFINPTLIQCRIPLVPILGETYQLEMETGEKLYLEEICHHPAQVAYYMTGPDDLWTCHGYFSYHGALNGPNSVKGNK